MLKYTNNDFLGLLKNKSHEIKKMKVLEIYRFFHRFCTEKMRFYVSNPYLMIITLQYIQSTQLRRFHDRPCLKKNPSAYYRAIENMINISPIKSQILDKMSLILNKNNF